MYDAATADTLQTTFHKSPDGILSITKGTNANAAPKAPVSFNPSGYFNAIVFLSVSKVSNP